MEQYQTRLENEYDKDRLEHHST